MQQPSQILSGCVLGLTLGFLLVASPARAAFRYADGVTTTGGQFNAAYPPSNLINNGFTSPTNTIDTTGDYLSAGNNYATASGTAANFNLTFNFNTPESLTGMHVWNYVYRNGTGGSGSTNNGVNAYTLTFYSGIDGTGSIIGTFSGNLNPAAWNAINPAQTITFGNTNAGVRSVVMHVVSTYGTASFAGLDELAFETIIPPQPPAITSFTASTNWLAYGATATLNWQVGSVTSLVLDNGIGDVLSRTTNGVGSIQISPTNGHVNYTLTANGVESNSVAVVGLPAKQKLHIYLLLGQSNMQGAGTPFDPTLDGPLPQILQFGSRDGMESTFVEAQHPLTSLTPGSGTIGMGLEFARTMLASNTDPGVVICLINHALGSSTIQWWAPGVVDNKQINPATGLNYHLYDEALQRATNAAAYGVIKGVLWHQGEYNSNSGNSNPSPEPELYAQRLQGLVDNLRGGLSVPGLPFVCGKFVPTWTNSFGTVFSSGLAYRATVEAALTDLPDHRFNTACVDNAGLIGREDQAIHFDAASQRELGRRYAQKMMLAQTQPSLGFLVAGGQLELVWSPAQLGWALQMNTNGLIGPATNWVTVSGSQTTNLYQVSLDLMKSAALFRLAQP